MAEQEQGSQQADTQGSNVQGQVAIQQEQVSQLQETGIPSGEKNAQEIGKDPYDLFLTIVLNRLEMVMKTELAVIKAELIGKLKEAEKEREKQLYDEYMAKLRKVNEIRQGELDQCQRIINIQAALLSRILEEDKDSVLRVLRTANLSEDELMLLSGDGRARRERV